MSRFGGKATRASRSFLQHFRGNLDNWDAPLVDTLAESREVVLVDNTDVGLSTGSGAAKRDRDDPRRDRVRRGDRPGRDRPTRLVAPDQVRKRLAAALESARR
jgi:hypothetical protein